MASSNDVPIRSSWQPEPRPAWVTALNRFDANPDSPSAFVSLDGRSLLDAAVDATGLDDFGDDSWREPFRLLVDDLQATAELTLIGRIMARSEVVRSLIARLQIAEAYRLHPEIESEVIDQPIFITGMARSGTTILHELLAEDRALRAPLSWELLYPCPPPEAASRATDPRVAKATADFALWDEVTPEFRTMHENRGDAPNECSVGMLHEFASPIWGGPHDVPHYDRWLAFNGTAQGYRFHRRLLRLLQWRAPGRWMLKGPAHLATLPALFAEYPDARVVVTHRDPLKVIPSLVSLMATMRWQRSDKVDYERIAQIAVFSGPFLLNQMMEQRGTSTTSRSASTTTDGSAWRSHTTTPASRTGSTRPATATVWWPTGGSAPTTHRRRRPRWSSSPTFRPTFPRARRASPPPTGAHRSRVAGEA
jgi:hypothetical protein